MKKNRGFLRFILIVALIMGGLTVLLLFLAAKREENNHYIVIDPETLELVQLEPPKDGDPIAIVDTTLGEFRFVLYPDRSPNAVKNFTELAESGYYDNTYVFDSQGGAYAAAGSKLKNGELNENYDKSRELVERELDQDLWPFRGAVCMMNTAIDRTFWEKAAGGGTYFNGSRFLVVNSIDFTDELKEELLEVSESRELGEAFIDLGGVPNFSQQMTVIGQTYEGFDVIEALSSLEAQNNGYYDIPVDDIMINSVTISSYQDDNNGK